MTHVTVFLALSGGEKTTTTRDAHARSSHFSPVRLTVDKSSHPDQSVADLTHPRRFLMKSSLTRSVAPLYSAARKCEPFIRSSFFRSASKLSLFHSFPLAGLSVEF